MKFITHLYTFYMCIEQNCKQFDALSFLSFVPVTTEHAKALYKLRLVLVNAKGGNITSLELPEHCHANIVGDMLAGKVELLSIQKVLNTVSGHNRGPAIIGDRTLDPNFHWQPELNYISGKSEVQFLPKSHSLQALHSMHHRAPRLFDAFYACTCTSCST